MGLTKKNMGIPAPPPPPPDRVFGDKNKICNPNEIIIIIILPVRNGL